MREYIQSSLCGYFSVISGVVFIAMFLTTLIMTIKPLRVSVGMKVADYAILAVLTVAFGTLTWVLYMNAR